MRGVQIGCLGLLLVVGGAVEASAQESRPCRSEVRVNPKYKGDSGKTLTHEYRWHKDGRIAWVKVVNRTDKYGTRAGETTFTWDEHGLPLRTESTEYDVEKAKGKFWSKPKPTVTTWEREGLRLKRFETTSPNGRRVAVNFEWSPKAKTVTTPVEIPQELWWVDSSRRSEVYTTMFGGASGEVQVRAEACDLGKCETKPGSVLAKYDASGLAIEFVSSWPKSEYRQPGSAAMKLSYEQGRPRAANETIVRKYESGKKIENERFEWTYDSQGKLASLVTRKESDSLVEGKRKWHSFTTNLARDVEGRLHSATKTYANFDPYSAKELSRASGKKIEPRVTKDVNPQYAWQYKCRKTKRRKAKRRKTKR